MTEFKRVLPGPIYRVVSKIWFQSHFLIYRFLDLVDGRFQGSLLDREGFYRIEPESRALSNFWYYLHVGKRHRRDRIKGRHEMDVMQTLLDHVSEETQFWEVGAWHGYFSLSLAGLVDQVVAFEARDYSVEKLRAAIDKNGFGNVETVNERIESLDRYVERFGSPDLILMDIEGWEYQVLESSPELLDHQPVCIIEVHEESGWIDGEVTNPEGETEQVVSPEVVDPEGLRQLFEDHGYTVEEVARRRSSNYHIVAVPEN